MPKLIAIAAMASNRVIGRDGDLPWHLPEDLKFFKQTTQGHPVLMGRKTFESIFQRLGKPLPGRTNIVLSHTMPPRQDATIIRTFNELASLPGLTSPVIYLIGGAQLYDALLPQCDELLLTCLDQPYEGDAWFPAFESLFHPAEILLQGNGFEIRRYLRTQSSFPTPCASPSSL
ncbi:dihydrofolate reductase [Phragmitibacter flavus]|uniref:dihydrofolate reductase n=1 Tax=Phragmitibacter flavus TaxID=2576071 RepID=A0A5R8KG72_9BACT|nr:dihydrofolate reductase [Phragmitibacter flavus]TLD70955.1 dihydrofolate reductase [Phragmitibacter flavus]